MNAIRSLALLPLGGQAFVWEKGFLGVLCWAGFGLQASHMVEGLSQRRHPTSPQDGQTPGCLDQFCEEIAP